MLVLWRATWIRARCTCRRRANADAKRLRGGIRTVRFVGAGSLDARMRWEEYSHALSRLFPFAGRRRAFATVATEYSCEKAL